MPKEPLLEKINRQPVVAWIVLISAMVGLGAAIKDLLSGSSGEEKLYAWLVIGLIFGLIVFFVLKEHNRKPKATPLEPGDYFYGIFPAGNKSSDRTAKKAPLVWARPEDEGQITKKIINSVDDTGDYLVLVGQSGAGKSTIIRKKVAGSLGKDWQIVTFDEYGDNFRAQFCHNLTKECPEANFNQGAFKESGKVVGNISNRCLLIFFDQFEQFLLHAEMAAKKKISAETISNKISDLDWFASVMASLQQHTSIVPLIAIRQEWFYNLHFLKKKVPSPLQVMHLRGVRPDDVGHAEVLQAFEIVTDNPELAKRILADLGGEGEIQPVEIQIVGQMIENELGENETLTEEKYLKEWHGIDGLLEKFLTISLEAAPDEETAAEIIFALSAEKTHRHPLTVPEICLIVHKSETLVREAIKYFVNLGHVRTTAKGSVELSHDYLADKFYTFSGSNLSAANRDNILYFWHAVISGRVLEKPVIPGNNKRGVILSDLVFYGLLAVLFTRLFAPVIAPKISLNWQAWNPLRDFQKTTAIIDWHYLPVFASHLAWSIYVCSFYKNFLFHLQRVETTAERFFSRASVILCAVCVLAAVVSPPIFIFSIGLGGLGVAWRFWLFGRRSELPANAKQYFKDLALNTLFNCMGACIVGAAIFYFACRYPSENQALLKTLFWVTGFGLTLAAYSVIKAHTTERAATTMSGYLDRGRSVAKKAIV